MGEVIMAVIRVDILLLFTGMPSFIGWVLDRIGV